MPPIYSSPGNYVVEKDFSEYAPAVNSSIAGVVGFASMGKPNVATLITSPAQLIRTFGTQERVSGGQAILAALEILSRTNSIYFVRAEDSSTAADASAGVSWGVCPAIEVSGMGRSADLELKITATDSAGNDITPGGSPYTLSFNTGSEPAKAAVDAQAAVQTNDWPWIIVSGLAADNTDFSGIQVVGSHPGKTALLTVSATSGTDVASTGGKQWVRAVNAGTGAASGTPSDGDGSTGNSLTASGGTAERQDNGGVYLVESLYSGSGYNASAQSLATGVKNHGLKVQVTQYAGKNSQLDIIKDGAKTEGFSVSMMKNGASAGNFPEDVINTAEVDLKSDYVKAQFLAEVGARTDRDWTPPLYFSSTFAAGNADIETGDPGVYTNASPKWMKLMTGTYDLSGGKNGDAQAAGTITGTVKSALMGVKATKTGIHALDDDSLNISMACVPGITEQSVQNELITLAESSQNFLAVVSPPEGLTTAQKAINWHNGNGDGRTAAINTSYAAIYWPWLKIFDVNTNSDIYIDPAAYAISVMCHTDAVADPWFAPAGLTRGRLTKPTDIEVILNQGDRDQLYQPGNAINPIAKFAQDGICIWGQRTAQRTPSALDRVNVRRMMITMRKMILEATRSVIFEPNDPLTWSRVTTLLSPMLDDVRRRRGITEFRVICDETTNTPVRIDRNELWCRVLIKPTKTAEVLVFELNLTNQSSDLGV